MAKVKIVVNEMPQKSIDCPFAIECKDYPCICDLKRDKSVDIHFGITFGWAQRYNCSLDDNKDCDMLTTLS